MCAPSLFLAWQATREQEGGGGTQDLQSPFHISRCPEREISTDDKNGGGGGGGAASVNSQIDIGLPSFPPGENEGPPPLLVKKLVFSALETKLEERRGKRKKIHPFLLSHSECRNRKKNPLGRKKPSRISLFPTHPFMFSVV